MWTSNTAPVVGNDPNLWTIAEAAVALGLTPAEVRTLRAKIIYTHVFPVGKRKSMITSIGYDRTPKQGRYAMVYRASELIELVELLCIVRDTVARRRAQTRTRGIM